MSNPFEETSVAETNPREFEATSPNNKSKRKMTNETKHKFQSHNYKRPTFCAHCKNLLVGVFKQGMRCKRCNVDVHEKCQEDLDKPCIEMIVGQHNFREKTYKQPTFCDSCTKLLVGLVNQGLKCSECGANVHEKCQARIEEKCEQTQSRKTRDIDKIKREKVSRQSTRSKRGGGSGAGTDKIPLQTMGRDSADAVEADALFATMPSKTKSKLDSPVVARRSVPMGSPASSPRSSRAQSMTPEAAAAGSSGSNKITQAQVLVDDVVDIMTENVKKMNDRGEKLETLKDNAEQLEEKANLFEKKSKELKRKMWFKNFKMWIILIIAALVVIAIIVVSVVLSKKK